MNNYNKILDKINSINEKIGMGKIPTIEFNSQLNTFLKQQKSIFNKINSIKEKIQIPQIHPGILKIITDLLIIDLFNDGWFITEKIPSEIKFNTKIMKKYFIDNLDTIEKNIIKQYPKRAPIIKSAFQAHREKKYELSVPIILMQVDGICKEVARGYFFTSTREKKQKPQTAKYVEEYMIDTVFLHPLEVKTSINKSGENKIPNKLNRHTIIHGDCLDYGSEINSLKAISLINYVTETFDNNTKYYL